MCDLVSNNLRKAMDSRPRQTRCLLLMLGEWWLMLGLALPTARGAEAMMVLEFAESNLSLVSGGQVEIKGKVRNLVGVPVAVADLGIFLRSSAGHATNLTADFSQSFVDTLGPGLVLPASGYVGSLLTVSARYSQQAPSATSVRLELTTSRAESGKVQVSRAEAQINFPRLAVRADAGDLVLSWFPSDSRVDAVARASADNKLPWTRLTNAVVEIGGGREFRIRPKEGAYFYRLQMR
jgi:hypothetical protein